MSVQSKRTIISSDKMPRINGSRFSSIYSYQIEPHGQPRDCYHDKPDFWEFPPLSTSKWAKDRRIKLKELPHPFNKFLGVPFEWKGKTYRARNMWFRESDSANGSFTDQTVTLNCGDNRWLSMYIGCEHFIKGEHIIEEDSWLGKLILEAVGLNLKDVPELPVDTGYYYPQTHIVKVDFAYYPDTGLPSWRWLYGSPYVTNGNGKKQIRVLHRESQMHVFLEQVYPEAGDDNLVMVTFPAAHDKQGDSFCNVMSWAHTKEGAANEIIRWEIERIKESKEGWPVVAHATVNCKRQFKRETWNDCWYKIVRMVPVADIETIKT
jgi:hypothetical protein